MTEPRALFCGAGLRLFTHWGTVVYYDAEQGRFRHGPLTAVRQQACLVACGTTEEPSLGAVLVAGVGPFTAAACGLDETVVAEGQASQTVLEMVGFSGDTLKLRANGLFLSAEEDGRITLSRTRPLDWETFTVARSNRAELLRRRFLAGELSPLGDKARHEFDVRRQTFIQRTVGGGRFAVICDISWLQTYLASEHYHFVRHLHVDFGYDIVDSKRSDFTNPLTIQELDRYESVFVTWTGDVDIPTHRISTHKVVRIDDLDNNDRRLNDVSRRTARYADLLVGPYAYEMPKYFPHPNIVWTPYSSAIEDEGGFLPFNENPIEKILLSGSVAWDRPFRSYVFGLTDDRLDRLGHPGYNNQYNDISEEIVKDKWQRYLNRYICAFCDAHSLRYVHLRIFEIATSGALLLADKLIEAELSELGFVDGVNCVLCDAETFLEKVAWILRKENRHAVDEMRRQAKTLAELQHTTRFRVRQFAEIVENGVVSQSVFGERADQAGV